LFFNIKLYNNYKDNWKRESQRERMAKRKDCRILATGDTVKFENGLKIKNGGGQGSHSLCRLGRLASSGLVLSR